MGLLGRKQPKDDAGTPVGLVTISKAGPVATIRINNAAHRNVMTSGLTTELTSAFHAISADDSVRCVVLGAEGANFSAGPPLAELKEFAKSFHETGSKAAAHRYWRLGKGLTDAIEGAPQQVICAIRGSCVSVGLAVALACDFRLAASNAVIAFPDVQYLKMVPGWGATQRLTPIIGSQRAKYALITGERFNADKAKEYGIVLDVVPSNELDTKAREIAERIAMSSQTVLEQTKQAVDGGVDVEYETSMRLEEKAWLAAWMVPNRLEIIEDAIHKLSIE